MVKNLYAMEPQVINHVVDKNSQSKIIEIATRNKNKIEEIQKILKNYIVVGKDLKVDEIQSLDAYEVVEKKAKLAWEKNNFRPILVEDTSLEITALGGRPGTYINDFAATTESRLMLISWLEGKDRRAIARVIFGIFDGKEVHTREGKIEGSISIDLRGSNGFGWDDFFIPKGSKKTFAEMESIEKDKFSMRRLALEKFIKEPINLGLNIYMIPEPFDQELDRLRLKNLQNLVAKKFAYRIQSVEFKNKVANDFEAPNYSPVQVEKNRFFKRYLTNPKSSSLGLILTDIDRASIALYKNEDPVLWQFGPKRRKLALAQRAEFFLEHQNSKIKQILSKLNLEGVKARNNKRSATIEKAMGTNMVGDVTKTMALKEIGYKKISSDKIVSRSNIGDYGLYNKVGKYPRSIFGIGSMPPISGWRDVLVTAAVGHMPIFTHRNSINSIDTDNQIKLINEAKEVIDSIGLDKESAERAKLNIGAALGCGDVQKELLIAKKLYKKAGVKLFRIYTINSDPRVIDTAKSLRKEFGDAIEIFVGQISDKKQALRLIENDIKVDGMVFGHGGGMQCTSATNGMALTTLEELYDIVKDPRFNDVTIVAEGGVGKSVGALLIMGIDLILCNQKLVHGTIELGELFFEHKKGGLCQPYHGSASAPTMLIESENPELMESRLYYSGRAKKIEGSPGYMFFESKANSMVFFINEFKHYAARTLADLGVSNMQELREFLSTYNNELLRIISSEAAFMGNTHSVT